MNIAIAAAILAGLLAPGADVVFETDGVRVGDVTVNGPAFEVKETAQGALLVSGSGVESLSSEIRIQVGAGRTLVLEPGVRLSKEGESYFLTVHGARKIHLQTADGLIALDGPLMLAVSEIGWTLGNGLAIQNSEIRASLVARGGQDNKGKDKKKGGQDGEGEGGDDGADALLQEMEDAAAGDAGGSGDTGGSGATGGGDTGGGSGGGTTLVFTSGDPALTSEASTGQTIQALEQVTSSGAP